MVKSIFMRSVVNTAKKLLNDVLTTIFISRVCTIVNCKKLQLVPIHLYSDLNLQLNFK